MPSDRALIARALKQDQHAFSELVKRHQSALRYSLRQLTGWDVSLADDLAQETFIRVYKNLNQYRGDSEFFTWVYRIAYRVFAANYRSRQGQYSRQTLSLMDDDVHYEKLDSDSGNSLENNRLQVEVSKMLEQFQPEQRAALHLHLHREYTHQEIADIMNCPLGTVKSHIQRGKAKLREQMQARHEGEAGEVPTEKKQ